MALFDLPAGSHCTAAIRSPLPIATTSEFNIWKAWIRSLPLFSKWKSPFHLTWFNSKMKLRPWSVGGIVAHGPSPDYTSISWSFGDLKGMITPFSPQRYTYREPFRAGSRVAAQHSNCSHGDGQTHMTWKAEHTVWREDYQFTGKQSQVSPLSGRDKHVSRGMRCDL